MKRERPGPEATNQQMWEWVHECIHDNFLATNWKNWLQLGGIAALVWSVLSVGGQIVFEAGRQTALLADHSTVLARMQISMHEIRQDVGKLKVDVSSLQVTANANAKSLNAAYSKARGHSR
jgi:hypothetical protein